MGTKVELELINETCITCGTPFAMERNLREQRMKTHEGFYCPNGHSMIYPAESDKEKVQRLSLENLKLKREKEESDRKLNNTLETLARVNKHIENGVCPKCHRHFVNLERHMCTKHSKG
jgi:aspartate/glutamate racemase